MSSLLKSQISSAIIDVKPTVSYTYADNQYKILMESIIEFQNTLDEDHEVGAMLSSFGQNIIMNVTNLGYANPSLIIFYGYVNGQRCELYQHINQINFLLMACPKIEPNKPARRIGFSITDNE